MPGPCGRQQGSWQGVGQGGSPRAWMLAHLDSKAGKLAPFFVPRVLTPQQAWCQHPLKRSELTWVQQLEQGPRRH